MARLACVALLAAILAGCGDHKLYQLIIDNAGSAGVVVVATGVAQDKTTTELVYDPAFRVGPSSRAVTPTIAAGLSDEGRWEMVITVLSADCRPMDSVVLDSGASLITIDAAGLVTSTVPEGGDDFVEPSAIRPEDSPCD